MLCSKCNKNPATVHVQQYINNMKSELHLCQECSLNIGADMLEHISDNISMETIFQGFLEQMQKFTGVTSPPHGNQNQNQAPPIEKAIVACPKCTMTYEDFKASGKLGCATCYLSFARPVEALLKNVHGSTRHEGKYPQRSGAKIKQQLYVEELRANLKNAIAEENFEEAARLRDEIRILEVSQ